MSVTVHLHKSHRHHAGGNETVSVSGGTVGECLRGLFERFPAMERVVFDAGGKLKNSIEIYLNMESAFPGELERETRDGDDIHILLMVAGG